MGLKRRFVKDSKFFQDYQKFMDNLLKNGYARSDATPSGRTWYISHHGVYHPSKPGKICVVFDCSAEFQGNCINKELSSGPDLTNQIIGVLMRFREKHICAFMADVEAMYYQVQVPEYQQSFLKFLWWENHDIEKEPQDFVMCAHLFGGTSSASCLNYAYAGQLQKVNQSMEELQQKPFITIFM